MGTRSITRVLDKEDNAIIEMYRQYDGYPKGMGQDLVNFVKDGVLTNGIAVGETRKTWNGMECFAASLVANFKTGVGNIYLHSPTQKAKNKKKFQEKYWAEYVYEISENPDGNTLKIRCWDTFSGKELNLEKELQKP